MQGAGISQHVIELGRAEVGKESEFFADGQQGPFRAEVSGQSIPFVSADRPQQHAVAVFAGVQRLVGQRHAVLVDRAPAGHDRLVPESPRRDLFEDLQGCPDDLRADSVTFDDCQLKTHASSSIALNKPPARMIFWRKAGNGGNGLPCAASGSSGPLFRNRSRAGRPLRSPRQIPRWASRC
jgi:hypothetical protein